MEGTSPCCTSVSLLQPIHKSRGSFREEEIGQEWPRGHSRWESSRRSSLGGSGVPREGLLGRPSPCHPQPFRVLSRGSHLSRNAPVMSWHIWLCVNRDVPGGWQRTGMGREVVYTCPPCCGPVSHYHRDHQAHPTPVGWEKVKL